MAIISTILAIITGDTCFSYNLLDVEMPDHDVLHILSLLGSSRESADI